MPVYEYVCPKCDKKFEIFHRSKEIRKLYPCPDCGTLSPKILSVPHKAIFSPYLKELGGDNMLDY